MQTTKTQIFNLALSALLLAREIVDSETDKTNEAANLRKFWHISLESTLEDLDLDSLSQPIALELIETLDSGPWRYVYKYPSNCAFLRRIKSCAEIDNKSTHISKRTGLYNGQKAIYTNQPEAIGECIPKDVPLEALSPMATMAVAYTLALLSAPLITGKGAKALKREIKEDYIIAKMEAQETDRLENFNYEAEWQRSEFVEARLS